VTLSNIKKQYVQQLAEIICIILDFHQIHF